MFKKTNLNPSKMRKSDCVVRAIYTPAAVDEYGNITSTAIITVPKGCCFTLAVRYVSAEDDPATTPTPVINLQNANLVINRVA